MPTYALLGKSLSHSFSPAYFANKFQQLGLENHRYITFEVAHKEDLATVFEQGFSGINVTIPYKESIIEHLDELDEHAKNIGAVNCIKILACGKKIGYNTDYLGFKLALEAFCPMLEGKALVLGTGGSSKAVIYALTQLGIDYSTVSRDSKYAPYNYEQITDEVLAKHHLIVNTTPLGMYPNVGNCPKLPYIWLTEKHFLFDLIYNPKKSLFLALGKDQGAKICNGLAMLEHQADESFKIWTEK